VYNARKFLEAWPERTGVVPLFSGTKIKFLGTTTIEFKSTNYHYNKSSSSQYSVFTILRTNISSVSEDRPSCMMAFISSRTGYGTTLDTENLGHTDTVTATGPKYI